MKKILFIMLLLCSISVTAYDRVGDTDTDFSQGGGIISALVFTARGVSSPQGLALAQDVNDDGTLDIFVLEGSGLNAYNGNDLSSVDEYLIDRTTEEPSFFTLVDIDTDGKEEIIVPNARVSAGNAWYLNVTTLSFNGTNLNLVSALTCPQQNSAAHGNIDGVKIACTSQHDCLVEVHGEDDSGSYGGAVNYYWTNGTVCNAMPTLRLDYGAVGEDRPLCGNPTPHMAVADYDGDTVQEIISSYFGGSSLQAGDTGEAVYITIFGRNATGTGFDRELLIEHELGALIGDVSGTNRGICSNTSNYITNPLVYDMDEKPSNGLETSVGILVDGSPIEFKVLTFKSNGDLLDDFPESSQVAGSHLGGLAAIKAKGTSHTMACAVIINAEGEDFGLLCGSTEVAPNHRIYLIDNLGYNLSNNESVSHSMIHAGNFIGDGRDELITSYGIMSIEPDGLLLYGDDLSLTYPFINTVPAAVIEDDFKTPNRDDFIAMSENILWYIDDGYSNAHCGDSGINCVSDIHIDPCPEQTWLQNTTVEILLTLDDPDGDDVAARVRMYHNETHVQDSGWTGNFTDGSQVSFGFTANVTTPISSIVINARDTDNPLSEWEYEKTFSVSATSGIVRGQCAANYDFEVVNTNITTPTATQSTTNNAVTNSLTSLSSLSGLSFALLWIIAIIAGIYEIWIHSSSHGMGTFGVVILYTVGMITLGTMAGALPFGFIIVMVLIAVLLIIMVMRRAFFGSGGG